MSNALEISGGGVRPKRCGPKLCSSLHCDANHQPLCCGPKVTVTGPKRAERGKEYVMVYMQVVEG